jgi:signal transduction histidine kinase
VDQTNDKVRLINVAKYLDEIIHSLHPKLKKTNHCVKINCDQHIEIFTHPGAIAQIIINLIINSIIHGFDSINRGEITITAMVEKQRLIIVYHDNGVGVDDEELGKLFDPFYTTQADKGGTGLGTHIIKNLVVGTLNGTVKAYSDQNKGLSYRMTLPDMRYS